MFTEISWGTYITIVIVLLAVYYLFIGFRYYRRDLSQLISGGKTGFPDKAKFTASKSDVIIKPRPHEAFMQLSVEDQNLYQLLQSLSDEIQALLGEAGNKRLNKDEIITALKILIAKYSVLKNSSFRESIQNLIQTESETNCSIHLSEKELSELW
ncbi:MAG: hypothetical protein JWN83_1036 [Chitinophagaceae bacterium]|nr:hypothetical protein [Chitinophagaceae bacterium]